MSVPRLAIEIRTPCPPQPLPRCRYQFRDPRDADADGYMGYGGDFEPSTVVGAYSRGIFPWPHPQEEYLWFSPDPRAVIFPGDLHVSRRLARTLRQGRFRFTVDAAFERVMRACADRPEGTWITEALIDGYTRLHHLGWAHSVEAWAGEELAGGLYGVRCGPVFGAESMFHRLRDASKAAMVAMMQWAEAAGVRVVDIQVLTPHTASMGGIEIPRSHYLAIIEAG
jgi:leucyl/phenylalanyl-tRNA--protein transferase